MTSSFHLKSRNMKKIELVPLILFSTLTIFCFGQQPKFVYCQIVCSGGVNPLASSNTLQFSFGDNLKLYEEKLMKDGTGKKIKINGTTNALNFMAKNGWELDQTSSLALQESSIHELVYIYILRKNFADLEEDVKQDFLKN